MANLTKFLSAGLEDYIETIYISKLNRKPIKGIDLARALNISRASVSEALSKLVSKGLIEYQSRGEINLTSTGEKEAKEVYSKHNILKTFFEEVLSISPDEASENACKIEHIISKNILDEINNFTLYCKNNHDIIKNYINNKIEKRK